MDWFFNLEDEEQEFIKQFIFFIIYIFRYCSYYVVQILYAFFHILYSSAA